MKEKENNHNNCQQGKTVIINGVKYPNIPDAIRRKIEEIAKKHGPVKQ